MEFFLYCFASLFDVRYNLCIRVLAYVAFVVAKVFNHDNCVRNMFGLKWPTL